MQCPKCKKDGLLGRVKVLATNVVLRVCNSCSRTWLEGQNPEITQATKLSDFIRSKGINVFDLIDVEEDHLRRMG